MSTACCFCPSDADNDDVCLMCDLAYECQQPRHRPITDPLSTVVGSSSKHALVTAWILTLKNNVVRADPREPLGTVCSGGQHYGVVSPVCVPQDRSDKVRAFLVAYYKTDQNPDIRDPLPTVTSKDRFGLVSLQGEDWAIADLLMRMLKARELFRAMGFRDTYKIDPVYNCKPLSLEKQVACCGNSVCPPVAEALVRANAGFLQMPPAIAYAGRVAAGQGSLF